MEEKKHEEQLEFSFNTPAVKAPAEEGEPERAECDFSPRTTR